MKLRSHLVALVVVALMPLVLFSVIVVTLVAKHERDETDRGLRSNTRALSVAVEGALERAISALTALAASQALDDDDLERFHRVCRRAVAAEPGWLSVALFDPAGRQLFDTLRPYGASLPATPDAASVRRVLTARGPAVSDFVSERGMARDHFVVAIPVFRGGEIGHVLLAALTADAIASVLSAQHLPHDWIGSVIDGQGRVVARTVSASRFVGTRATDAYLAHAGAGAVDGSFRGPSKEGLDTYTAFRRLRVTDWTVALAIPTSIVEAPLRRFVAMISAGGVIFLVIGILVAAFLGRRIARPIAALSSSAEALGRGSMPVAVADSTVAELQAVGESIVTAAERRREIEAERAGLLAREQEARADAERLQARYAFLAEASSVLASSLDYAVTLQSVARLAVPRLADLCVIDIVDERGDIRRVAAAHADPARQALVDELQRRFPPERDGQHPVARALRAGAPQIAGDIVDTEMAAIAPDADHARIAAALGYRSYLVVPMVARGRTLGAISLVTTESGRRYSAEDVPLADDLGDRAAMAIDNAWLLRQSEARQRAAEALAEVGRFLGQALDPNIVGERIADSVRALLGLQASVFYRVDPETLEMAAVGVAGEAVGAFDRSVMLPAGTATVGLAVRERRTITTPDFTADPRLTIPDAMRARLTSVPYRSVLAVPLITHDRVVGVLALGDHPGREFTSEEILLAQGFADQAALALENARLYAEAREANRAKDEFLATLSHELRTPLTAMLGWVRMLQSGRLDETTGRRALEIIDRNTKLQAQLIDDLLDVSRIITGKLHLDMRAVDVVAVIDGAVEAVVQGAEAKSITLTRTLDPSAGPVWGDAHRLQQVVWNLLSNAIKFTPSGGSVDVRLERRGDSALIRVMDTGKGIHAEFLPVMFDRFRQADSTSTRAYGGLGVGLAIVRHLVELHRGTVRAESPGEGRGATFTVTLPIADGGAVVADTRRPGVERFPTLTGIRVLVVDDEPDARELLTAVLEQSGAEVTVVSSAREALAALDRTRPNVIVSDISMPDVDGYALIRKVRALGLDRGGRIPAVALSAYARAEDRARAIAVGFQMHVPKPVEPAELVDVVARLAGRAAEP